MSLRPKCCHALRVCSRASSGSQGFSTKSSSSSTKGHRCHECGAVLDELDQDIGNDISDLVLSCEFVCRAIASRGRLCRRMANPPNDPPFLASHVPSSNRVHLPSTDIVHQLHEKKRNVRPVIQPRRGEDRPPGVSAVTPDLPNKALSLKVLDRYQSDHTCIHRLTTVHRLVIHEMLMVKKKTNGSKFN